MIKPEAGRATWVPPEEPALCLVDRSPALVIIIIIIIIIIILIMSMAMIWIITIMVYYHGSKVVVILLTSNEFNMVLVILVELFSKAQWSNHLTTCMLRLMLSWKGVLPRFWGRFSWFVSPPTVMLMLMATMMTMMVMIILIMMNMMNTMTAMMMLMMIY